MSADGQMAPDSQAPVADAPGPTTQDTPPVNDAMMARLDELGAQMAKLAGSQQPDPEWQGGISDQFGTDQFQPDPGFDQQGFDPYGQQADQYQPGQYAPDQYQDPQQAQAQAMEQLQGFIREQVQQGVQQQVTPWMQQQRANELERQYPALADPKTAGEIVAQTAQYAQKLGRPELARDPQLVELVYLAQQAKTSAAQETPADGGQQVHLESGGAAPQQEEVDPATRMLQAWNKA